MRLLPIATEKAGAPITPWARTSTNATAVVSPSQASSAMFTADATKLPTIRRFRPSRSESRPLR